MQVVVTYFLISTLRPSVNEIKMLSGHIKDPTRTGAPSKMRGVCSIKNGVVDPLSACGRFSE
jgi:hypothetical protein